MIALGHVLFNLLCNSIGSFAIALAIVYALHLVRLESGRARLALLLLPFAKVVIDLAQGIPASSFLWAKLAGQAQELGAFRIGFWLDTGGLSLIFHLGAFSQGLLYPQSAADLIDTALGRRLGTWVPAALALACLALSAVRIALRVLRSRRLVRHAVRGSTCVELRDCGSRRVEVRISERYRGVPFAAGLLRPCVLFSARVHERLTREEREAALQHELAHVAAFDPNLLACVCLLEDLLWFVPGVRGLAARIRELLELRADARAVAAGVEPRALASALVSAGEILATPIVSAAIVSTQSSLGTRVAALIDRAPDAFEPARSRTRRFAVAALVVIAWATVAQASFFGNHAAVLERFAAG